MERLHPPKGPTEERGNLCTPRHCHPSHSSISRQDTGWEKWADPVYLTRGNDSTRSKLGRNLNTPGHLRAIKLHPGPGYRLKPLAEDPKDTSVFKKVPLLHRYHWQFHPLIWKQFCMYRDSVCWAPSRTAESCDCLGTQPRQD
jgi:hypothetical protein